MYSDEVRSSEVLQTIIFYQFYEMKLRLYVSQYIFIKRGCFMKLYAFTTPSPIRYKIIPSWSKEKLYAFHVDRMLQ